MTGLFLVKKVYIYIYIYIYTYIYIYILLEAQDLTSWPQEACNTQLTKQFERNDCRLT